MKFNHAWTLAGQPRGETPAPPAARSDSTFSIANSMRYTRPGCLTHRQGAFGYNRAETSVPFKLRLPSQPPHLAFRYATLCRKIASI